MKKKKLLASNTVLNAVGATPDLEWEYKKSDECYNERYVTKYFTIYPSEVKGHKRRYRLKHFETNIKSFKKLETAKLVAALINNG